MTGCLSVSPPFPSLVALSLSVSLSLSLSAVVDDGIVLHFLTTLFLPSLSTVSYVCVLVAEDKRRVVYVCARLFVCVCACVRACVWTGGPRGRHAWWREEEGYVSS